MTARQRVFDRFGVDTRALAVVRVGLALIIVVEWLGNMPGGVSGVVDALRWATMPAALLLLLGFRTRLTSVATWLIYGIPIREDLLTPGTEVFLGRYCIALVLFWFMFLPIGEHLSWDARGVTGNQPRLVLSVASAGLLLQFFVIYFWAGATKHLGEWMIDRTALHDVFSHPEFGSAMGMRLTNYPVLLEAASVATVFLEVLGAALLFVPWRGIAKRRIFLVGAFVAMHVGMAVFMSIHFFPYVMIVGWLVFLPPLFWNRFFGSVVLPETDTSRIRNSIAGVALTYVFVSSLVTWLYYPAREGIPGLIQEVGKHLLLYQQWAMFSMPSTL